MKSRHSREAGLPEGNHYAPVVQYPYDPKMCPYTTTWRIIGGRWKGVLWWRLSNGMGRFGDLRKAVPQISKKVLTQQLRELERDGVVRRTVYAEVPSRVEYELTEHGRSLAPVIAAISEWGARHQQQTTVAAPPPRE